MYDRLVPDPVISAVPSSEKAPGERKTGVMIELCTNTMQDVLRRNFFANRRKGN